MPCCDVYFHSPLSHQTLSSSNDQSLLLQFILWELCAYSKDPSESSSCPIRFFPYDYSKDVKALERLEEFGRLLACAFPNDLAQASAFSTLLKEELDSKLIFEALTPFLLKQSDSPSLLLFFLEKEEELKPLLGKKGLLGFFDTLFDNPKPSVRAILSSYQDKGFATLLPKIEHLLEKHGL